MIISTLKLRLNHKQETLLNTWLWNLTGVYNWAIRKIELDAHDNIYYSQMNFQNLLASHSKKLHIPSHVLQGVLARAHIAWTRCFKKISKRPHLKSRRNKLNSIPFTDPIHRPIENHINLPVIGKIRFHKQRIPIGKIKCGHVVWRPSGWYLCLFIDSDRKPIERVANGVIGIDPGFKDLLTLSTGEAIKHPRELELAEQRIAQSQRAHNNSLANRLYERCANRLKDRNHKLSLRLVRENLRIRFSKDPISKIARRFGKSVSSSGHYQLRQYLSYKSRSGGTEYDEPDSRNSTRACSTCGALTGPTGWTGLKVRQWECSACGAHHDRDVNAAVNALIAGLGTSHEISCAMA